MAELPAIDLAHLREFTDGDPEEEKTLFAIFLESADEALQKLAACTESGAEESWRQAAHMLKGTAGNLGAQALYAACREAETHHAAGTEAKRRYLDAIQVEMEKVREFIGKI